MKIAVNENIKGKSQDYDSLTFNYKIMELDHKEIAEHIRQGHAITNIFGYGSKREINELVKKDLSETEIRKERAKIYKGIEHKFHRHKRYFKSADWFGLDFDNDNPQTYFSLQELREGKTPRAKFIIDNAFLVYTTPSHTKEHNRFRALFQFHKTITDKQEFEAIVKLILDKFHGADKKCKDVARFYYGSGQNGIVKAFNNRLSPQVIKNAFKHTKEAPERTKEISNDITLQKVKTIAEQSNGEAKRNSYVMVAIQLAVQNELDKLSKAVFGNRNDTLNIVTGNIAKKVEGLGLSEAEIKTIKARIKETALSLGTDASFTESDIDKTIKSGWLYGKENQVELFEGWQGTNNYGEEYASTSLRMWANRDIRKMHGQPRDILFSWKQENIDEIEISDDTIPEQEIVIEDVLESITNPEAKKYYMGIWKYAQVQVTPYLKEVSLNEIVFSMYDNLSANKLRYEVKKLKQFIRLYSMVRFTYRSKKTGDIESFPLIGQYSIRRNVFSCILPMPISRMAFYFPDNIYQLRGSTFNLSYELWLNANRNFQWHKDEITGEWFKPNFELKPLKWDRKYLLEVAGISGIDKTNPREANIKLKKKFEELKALGHIKAIPNISGTQKEIVEIHLKNQ